MWPVQWTAAGGSLCPKPAHTMLLLIDPSTAAPQPGMRGGDARWSTLCLTTAVTGWYHFMK